MVVEMNDRRVMTRKDKWKFFSYKSKRDSTKYVTSILFIITLLFYLFNKGKNEVSEQLPTWILFLCLSIFGLAYTLVMQIIFLMIFFEKKEIVNGHVFKTHRGRESPQNTEKAINSSKAKAISDKWNTI